MRGLPITLSLVVLTALTSACGGGGGGGGSGLPTDLLAFVADGRVAGTFEIFTIAPPLGEPVAVSGPLVLGSSAHAPKWSPSKDVLGFLSNRDAAAQTDLFVVDPSGGLPVNLTPALDASVLAGFQWSPDCDRIAFFAQDPAPSFLRRLYAVTIKTGAVAELTTAGITDGQAAYFAWQPGSSGPKGNLAYRSDEEVPFRRDLYMVNADGTGHVRINDRTGVSDSSSIWQFDWSPDGEHLAFTYDSLAPFSSVQLFVATGLAVDEVSNISDASRTVQGYRWLPDSARLVFLSDTFTDDVFDLGIAYVNGDVPLSLTFLTAPKSVNQFTLSADGLRIAYQLVVPNTSYQLRVHGTYGGGDLLIDAEGGFDARYSPDSVRIAYTRDVLPGFLDESRRLFLFIPPNDHVEPTSGYPIDPEFDVSPATEWSPTGEHLLCAISLPDPADVTGIYVVSKDGGAPVRLSAPITEEAALSTGGGYWSASGQYVAFEFEDGNFIDGLPLRIAKVDGSLEFDPMDVLQPTVQAKGFVWR